MRMSTLSAPRGSGSTAGRRRKLEAEERRDLARKAVDGEQIDPVPRRLDVQNRVSEREHIGEWRPRLRLGEDDDPRVIAPELELALGQDHSARDFAA